MYLYDGIIIEMQTLLNLWQLSCSLRTRKKIVHYGGFMCKGIGGLGIMRIPIDSASLGVFRRQESGLKISGCQYSIHLTPAYGFKIHACI